jgi:hypothetical protein
MIIRYTKVTMPNAPDGFVRVPLLRIRLSWNKKKTPILWTLIDSGADISLFSKEIAEILALDVTTGRPFPMSGVEGGQMNIWVHQANIEIPELGAIDTLVAFTNTDHPEVPILGQRGFFDKYQVRFQRYKDEIEIWPRSTSD